MEIEKCLSNQFGMRMHSSRTAPHRTPVRVPRTFCSRHMVPRVTPSPPTMSAAGSHTSIAPVQSTALPHTPRNSRTLGFAGRRQAIRAYYRGLKVTRQTNTN